MDEFFSCVVPPLRVLGRSDMQRWSDKGFQKEGERKSPLLERLSKSRVFSGEALPVEETVRFGDDMRFAKEFIWNFRRLLLHLSQM